MKLGDVCIKIGSGATPRGGSKTYIAEGIPVIRSQNVRDWSFDVEGLVYIDDEQASRLAGAEVKSRDVLLNITGDSVARACMAPDQFVPARVNQHVAIVRAGDQIDPLFLLCWLQMMKPMLLKMASSGATRNALTKSMIGSLEIDLPSLGVQRRIASVVEALQAKIAINRQVNDYLAELGDALFAQTIEENEREIHYRSVESFCEVKGGKRLPKGSELIAEANSHPYIRVRDLNNASVLLLTSEMLYVDDETQSSISRYVVNTGDVIVSVVGTIGLTAYIGKTLDDANLTENCNKLTSFKGEFAAWSYFFLRSSMGMEAIRLGTVGAVQAKLPLKNIKSMNVPFAPAHAMERATSTLNGILEVIQANILESLALGELRDALLPKLISGEIDVSQFDAVRMDEV